MVPLVEYANRHSSKASALSYIFYYLFFFVLFFISDVVTSFCLQAMVLGNF